PPPDKTHQEMLTLLTNLTTTLTGIVSSGVTCQPRRYYLTQRTHQGAAALTACAPGFHMASLWEIFDPSNLAYDTELGAHTGDTGTGPPSLRFGWIRTGAGGPLAELSVLPGQADCVEWTAGGTSRGTAVALEGIWGGALGGPAPRLAPWRSVSSLCEEAHRVWCIENF